MNKLIPCAVALTMAALGSYASAQSVNPYPRIPQQTATGAPGSVDGPAVRGDVRSDARALVWSQARPDSDLNQPAGPKLEETLPTRTRSEVNMEARSAAAPAEAERQQQMDYPTVVNPNWQ